MVSLRLAGWVALAGLQLMPTRASELPERHQLAAQPMLCRVDASREIRRIPRALFGTNLEWFNYANGMSLDGTMDPVWPTLMREQGLHHLRFPGGTLADFYHWKDGIGPQSKRPVREHPTDDGRSPNVFGTPELLRLAKATDTVPLITVNAGTGTAAEAAEWVAYCNQPDHPLRAADGLPSPANVTLWEIGNELYLPGNPTDKKITTVAPEVYANRFVEFASAMRKVDPSIKLMAIATANSTTVSLPYPRWTETLLKKAGAEIDWVAVHNAYFPMTMLQPDVPLNELYRGLWASPEAVDASLKDLVGLIERHESKRRIEIAVTEWGTLFSFHRSQIDHVKTLGSAVYLARLMQVFLKEPRVTLASYFKFSDRTFMGWVAYDHRPKVPYHVVKLFARHFGTVLVDANIESPTYDIGPVGVAPAANNVPELTVVASRDDSRSRLYINIVNRSWETIHQVKFDLGSFSAADEAKTYTLSSPGPTDHNGRDMAPEVPPEFYNEPPLSRDFAGPIKIESGTIKKSEGILVPPYSIVTVEFSVR